MKFKFKEGKNYKSWRKIAFCFLILFLISGIYLIFTGNKDYEEFTDFVTCSETKYFPTWVQDYKIIGYGNNFIEDFIEKKEQQCFYDVVNDYLIPNEISFYYYPSCSACHKQINKFGDSWEQYKKSGLTIDCAPKEILK